MSSSPFLASHHASKSVDELAKIDAELDRLNLRCEELLARCRDAQMRHVLPAPVSSESVRTRI